MRNNTIATIVTAACTALLTACGGGGGGGGTPSVDLSTPSDVAQAAGPALAIAASSSSAAAARASGKAASHNLLRSPQLRSQRASTMAKSRSAPMATTTEPCQTSGQYVSYDPETKDVNSPFTESTFLVYRYADQGCTEVETYTGGSTTFYSNGSFETGCPTNDEACNISYEQSGTPGSRFKDVITQNDDEFGEFKTTITHYLRADSQYNPADGSTEDRVFLDFDVGFTGEGESITMSGTIGTSSVPFQTVTNESGLTLEGSYAFSSPDFPECALGRATVSTIVPLLDDPNTFNPVGELGIEAGSHNADVVLNADGSATVSVDDGAPTTLTAEEVDAALAECPPFLDF